MRKPKLKNRPIKIEKPTGEACKACFGSGVIRGAVSEYHCGECGGLGLVSTDQDYFADLADALASALIVAKRDLAEQQRIISQLQGSRSIGSRID